MRNIQKEEIAPRADAAKTGGTELDSEVND
jgi:hypothetical protein